MRTPGPVALGTTAVPLPDSPYWQFYDEVATAQLARWLPIEPVRVLDVSGGQRFAGQLAAAGHQVVHVLAAPGPVPDGSLPVVADAGSLGWLRPACVDLVLAESQALSMSLATEVTVEHLVRVLRPGGRLLLVVESLMLGLARLAEQGRWAELADAPAADVVLVPSDEGTMTRCFWPEDLSALLGAAGLDVEWVRTRSVLSPATVERALSQGGSAALRTLVQTELALAEDREGESTGLYLVASARKPG